MMTNSDLAARCRAFADERVSDPIGRRAALCCGVALQESKTLNGARRILADVDHGPIRKAAIELFDELISEGAGHG